MLGPEFYPHEYFGIPERSHTVLNLGPAYADHLLL